MAERPRRSNVENSLAAQHGWKPGDRIFLKGDFFPINLELTIRGIYKPPVPARGIWFNWKTVEEALPYAKDDFYVLLADSAKDVPKIESAVDAMFHNSPQPTITETEKSLELDFISMLGNVKAFILSICLAVTFTIQLVSANTVATSARERTREVALLRTFGFTRQLILRLFLAEALGSAIIGGVLGITAASGLLYTLRRGGEWAFALSATPTTMVLILLIAALIGLLSAAIPCYRASRVNIVDGLRHLG